MMLTLSLYLERVVDEGQAAPSHLFRVLDLDEEETLASKQIVAQIQQGQ